MNDLLVGYRSTKRNLVQLLKETDDEYEKELIRSMISDCAYVIEWLKAGHKPGINRGIERRSYNQRTSPWDPLWMQSYAQPAACGSYTHLSENERFQIEEALTNLTDREREVYVMHYGMCFSMAYIANLLCISKSSVQTTIDRGKKKIEDQKVSSLFLNIMG